MPHIEMFTWNSILEQIHAKLEAKWPKRDRMRLAHKYQKMLDSEVVATRAELARYLGVSRARVTQMLRRLDGRKCDSLRVCAGDGRHTLS